ncbi:MAG: electron transport complex subunit E [Gammaproteobacteria bacterium]|nr:electron transport complex subunit E [Gammaproteobacteria bacterium]MDH5693298.1 electron transport complex subunit E [Gammaproteobacteria bacterium]
MVKESSFKKISLDGIWHNNPALIQILGLCPLLAVSSTFINALGLGLATILVLAGSNVAVSMIRNLVRSELRIPIYVLIIASFVTAVELAMNAYWHELYKILGIFIPLIVTNCAIIARAESFASKNTVPKALLDGVMMGLGFTLVLLVLGSIREIIGQGTLFAHAQLMFGEGFRDFQITLIEDYRGFLLAVLPPGAFFALGFLIALKNLIESKKQNTKKELARDLVDLNSESVAK